MNTNFRLYELMRLHRQHEERKRVERFEAEQAYLNSLTWTVEEFERYHSRIVGIENRFDWYRDRPSNFELYVWEAMLDTRPHPSHNRAQGDA